MPEMKACVDKYQHQFKHAEIALQHAEIDNCSLDEENWKLRMVNVDLSKAMDSAKAMRSRMQATEAEAVEQTHIQAEEYDHTLELYRQEHERHAKERR